MLSALARVLTIAMNTHREAVRARVLHALLALALATCVYSILVGTLSLHEEKRVVADIGAGSVSLYAVLVAIVLGATSLHREIELKTIFPILTRPLRRHEYLVGKYVGMLATLATFIALDGAAVFTILALMAKQQIALVGGAVAALSVGLGVLWFKTKLGRPLVIIPWSFVAFAVMAFLAAPAGGERQLVLLSCLLALAEVAIVAAVANFFAAFSSPFLTAVFTLGIFVVGRSTETLGNLPERVFGGFLTSLGRGISRIVPNLYLYVPPRSLLLGLLSDSPAWPYVAQVAANAVGYAVVLLVLSSLLFRRRDFQ
jgi:Cu-processing system permease protein